MNSDTLLAQNVKTNDCENSLKELIERHSKLCYNIYQKYIPAMSASGIFPDDALNDKDYIIYKSACSYNPTKKTKFSTWLGNQVRYYCLNKINKNKRYITLEYSALNKIVEKSDPPSQNGEFKDYITNLLSQMSDKRVEKIFHLRYFNEKEAKMTWANIATDLDVSSQTVINLHNKGKRLLKRKLQQGFRSDFL